MAVQRKLVEVRPLTRCIHEEVAHATTQLKHFAFLKDEKYPKRCLYDSR